MIIILFKEEEMKIKSINVRNRKKEREILEVKVSKEYR